jgi:uncharacterized protein YdhG (YjbR/CyaY superfamily)
MTKIALSKQQQVNFHLQVLDPNLRKIVEEIRSVILAADNSIAEQIKWNNISYYYSG